MFASCSSLHNLDLSSFNTEKCKVFTNMFDKVDKLTVKVNATTSRNLIDAIKDYVIIDS
jgi:surface protein